PGPGDRLAGACGPGLPADRPVRRAVVRAARGRRSADRGPGRPGADSGRAAAAPRPAVRAAGVLILVELAQGLIGFVQYFTHLPVLLVGFHMLGATLVWTATLAVLWSVRARPAA